jgi:hypothetical protein
MKLKPPDVPTPEITGGEKANARPAGILSNLAFTESIIDRMLVSVVLRWSQGLRATKTKALYVALVWVRRLLPTIVL